MHPVEVEEAHEGGDAVVEVLLVEAVAHRAVVAVVRQDEDFHVADSVVEDGDQEVGRSLEAELVPVVVEVDSNSINKSNKNNSLCYNNVSPFTLVQQLNEYSFFKMLLNLLHGLFWCLLHVRMVGLLRNLVRWFSERLKRDLSLRTILNIFLRRSV